MAGFENYPQELRDLDREIAHFAAICGIDVADRGALERCLAREHEDWADDKARQSLRGLLVLRIKVETEMVEAGLAVPPLKVPAAGHETDGKLTNH